ncbi:GNAT family N-acetyltransferase [Halalkalibacterium halodurans]|jgi:GNAT superfamily N-acetyltransferase|uniref:GNAT family N-acetyltransferase n=1 Tax=Halalkalibacterium halodurans TaxID=86665 RepID=UPI0006A98DBE|nr:GNAT family N-acetyltransferase [Halalkalibacterium halodurans]MED3647382.1 GNAT family N-acetyltransferase [Halalkalibacterium halodurans]MED4163519.1 GNAT family N-acetyltransferase [Halalkalibacterium halodurans]TPE70704.1 GNAT family N-acetyltransferase [Halalkalibacterium halodurans]
MTKDDPAIVYVYEQEGKPVGVFSFLKQVSWYLDFFYIDVSTIGNGYGRKMWHEMIACAKKENISSFLIESDPNAEPFYKKMGAHRIGETPSSVFANRMLPLLKVDVN